MDTVFHHQRLDDGPNLRQDVQVLMAVQVIDRKACRHDFFHLGIELPIDLTVIEAALAGPLDDFRITFRQQSISLDQGRYFLG